MLSKNEIIEFLKTNKTTIEDRYKVKKIALFGSYAKGTATQNSDIDILVDMAPSFDNFFDLKYFLEKNFDTKVDLGKEKNLRLLVKEKIKDELIYV